MADKIKILLTCNNDDLITCLQNIYYIELTINKLNGQNLTIYFNNNWFDIVFFEIDFLIENNTFFKCDYITLSNRFKIIALTDNPENPLRLWLHKEY